VPSERPIQRTFAALGRAPGPTDIDLDTDLGPGSDGTWVRAADLIADGARFDALIAVTAREWGTERADIAGAAVVSDWSFAVLVRAAACFLAARRVPALDHAAIWLHHHPEGWVDRVAFGPRFACLPGDDAAAHGDATVIEGEGALLDELRESFARHQQQLVQAAQARCRRPVRALWRHASDTLAEAFMWAGEALSCRDEAWAWGTRAMAGAPVPLAGPAGYRLWLVGEREHVGRVRSQCCLNYRCADREYCFSCPLRDDEHRLQRLRESYGAEARLVGA
jgi:hypothetical protein